MITVIVEGPGDKRALPVLAKREHGSIAIDCINLNGKSNIVRRVRGFEDTVRRQYALGRDCFLVLVDGDVTSEPYTSLAEERIDLSRRAEVLQEELGVPVRVCWAVLEMESWLIGGIPRGSTYCGLRRVGRVPSNTETEPQQPKQWLEDHMPRTDYSPAVQECLARNIDLQEAKRRNCSLRAFLEQVL